MYLIIIAVAFVVLLALLLRLVGRPPFGSIWHYHESGCGRTFRLLRAMHPKERCPSCFLRSFSKTIVEMKCEGCSKMKEKRCNAAYYTDVEHKVGDKFPCPISGEPAIVKDVLVANPPPPIAPPQGKAGCSRRVMRTAIPFIAVPAIIISAAVVFVNWLVTFFSTAMTATASALAAVVTSVLAVLATTLPGIGWGLLGIILLGIVYWVLHVSVSRSAASFSEIYCTVHSAPDPINSLRELYRIPPDVRPPIVLRETVNRSRDTVLKQHLIISVLMIATTIGALTCYLSVKTFEAAMRLLQDALRLGSTNIILCVIIFYSAKLLFGLDNLFGSKTVFFKGMVLSLIYGTASALTLIILIIAGESLSGPLIATQLALGVIGEVVLNAYGAVTRLYWRTLGQTAHVLRARFWGWFSY